MKVCFKCNIEKPLSEFYKHKKMGDRRLNKCKECTKKDVVEYRANNLEKVREYDRNRPNAKERVEIAKKYRSTPRGMLITNRGKREWSKRNPEKRQANVVVGNAIRDGKLKKQPCEKCGHGKAQAHHDDYSKPLDVRWLCPACHAQHHKMIREAKRMNTKPTMVKVA